MPAPQYVLRSYGGGADVGQLLEPMSATDLSFAIAPTTGWVEDDGSPLGTVGPFTVVIDRFTNSVEKILCSSINEITGVIDVYVDMADGWSGRGYDTGGGAGGPQAHVPGGSASGVQTCWSSAEAKEANQAVFDLLGGGGGSTAGVPIGASVPFNGTPQTIPSGFHLEDGSAISRASFSALFTALIISATGTTTTAGATITGVSSALTPYMVAGQQVTVTASGGAVYTIQSVTSTTVVLTSGTGITAATGGAFIVYPHGAGDGTTTFTIPDSRGRTKTGQSQVGTNAQPTQYVGQTIGTQTVTLSQSQLPTTVGTSAAVSDPTHQHNSNENGNTSFETIYTATAVSPQWAPGGSGAGAIGSTGIYITYNPGNVTATASTGISVGAVSNSGGGNPTNVESPAIGCTWIIRVS